MLVQNLRRSFLKQINVVVLGADGLNLLQRIHKEYPQINIVITTTYEEYIVQAVQMQIRPAGYLSLPTTLSKMKDLIESILSLPQTAKVV